MNLRGFKNWLMVNRDSKNTVETYLRQMKVFFKSSSEFNQETVNSYLLERLEKRVAKATWNLDVSALRAYAEFLKLEINFPKNKKPDQKIQPHLEEKQLEEIFQKLKYMVNQNDKYQAILGVLFYSGLRINELYNLKREDFNFDNDTIIIRNTKGKTDRIVPFPIFVQKKIENFFIRTRENENAFNITEDGVRQTLAKIGREMGLNFNLHPHTFRHSCARYLLKITNNDYRTVQKLCGHKDIKTTMIYVQISNEEAIEKVQSIFKRKKK